MNVLSVQVLNKIIQNAENHGRYVYVTCLSGMYGWELPHRVIRFKKHQGVLMVLVLSDGKWYPTTERSEYNEF